MREVKKLPVIHPIAPEVWPSREVAEKSRWFSPVALGPRQAVRRTWVPAMVPWRASDDGAVTERVLRWFENNHTGWQWCKAR